MIGDFFIGAQTFPGTNYAGYIISVDTKQLLHRSLLCVMWNYNNNNFGFDIYLHKDEVCLLK